MKMILTAITIAAFVSGINVANADNWYGWQGQPTAESYYPGTQLPRVEPVYPRQPAPVTPYGGRRGETYTQYGNTVYGSSGRTWTQYGNTVYGSDGTSCTQYGNTTYCN